MKEEKKMIEAALFISGRSMSIEEMKSLTGIGAMGYLKNILIELMKEYDDRGSAIQIIEAGNSYEMRVRNDYINRVKNFAQETEISKPALRTLAYISKHDGLLKSILVKKIGSQAYIDVKELVESGFIKPEKFGRTAKLFVTEKFKKYFAQ